MSDMRFRSNPSIELRPFAELSPAQREPFRDLENDPGCYGLVIPKPPLVMNLKAIAHETAALIARLVTPAQIGVDADVVDLVLDGVLEVESSEGFVSGADAFPLLCSGTAHDTTGLSREALRYAQDLATLAPRTLSNALYFYNRIPLSPFWSARFAGAAAILGHLGADRGALATLLERHWVFSDSTRGWLSWSPKSRARHSRDEVTYKLYVSPRPERIRDAFAVLVRVLASFPHAPFKIGTDAIGLLRPDKLVTYFSTREEMMDVAGALLRELAGCDAHGVPFSAALDETGLLSWGIDPPESDRALQWRGRESWRVWVVERLGGALSIAKAARTSGAIEPWRFAIERARRHGIDVETWTPSAALWSAS